MANKQFPKKIGFLLAYDFYIHYFRSILDELQKYPGEFEIYIEDKIENLQHHDPDIVFFASGYGIKEFPNTIKVQVWHSCFSSKGVQYHPLHSENDFIVVNGKKESEIYEKHKTRPKIAFLPVGNTHIDLLFRPSSLTHEDIGLNPKVPTILYAPTFTRELTSISVFKDKLVNVLRKGCPECNIIIKVHPAINASDKVIQKKFPGLLPMFRMWHSWFEEASHQDGVYYVRDYNEDITEYMKLSNILVGDVSGVNFIWLATRKPMVLIDSWRTIPARLKNFLYLPSYYDANGPEWMYRDQMAYHSYRLSKIPYLLKTALSDDPLENTRKDLIEELFENNADGNTGKRIVNHLRTLPGL